MPMGTIMLNDKPCHIGQTLCAFFQHFQEHSGTANCPWLWIDQICINQSEVREKNHQIPLMSRIYSQCTYVIAWLGRTFSGFETLLNDRYFTRLWIVQEILLAPQVRILCGGRWIMWSDLQDSIASENAPSWTDVQPVALSLLLDHGQHGNGKSLCHYINYYSAQNCRDPRDKLYGLLGLVPEDQRPTIDYAKSILQVYIDTARAMHREYKPQDNQSVRPGEFVQACLELFTNMKLPRMQPKRMLLLLCPTPSTVNCSLQDGEIPKSGSERPIINQPLTPTEVDCFWDSFTSKVDHRERHSKGRSLRRRLEFLLDDLAVGSPG
jgi:hypothetical protein